MLETLVDFFVSYGYVAIFGVLILCGLGLPVPEDVSLISGGVIAGLGYADPYIMLAVSMAGVLIGDSTMFFIGRTYGERFLSKGFVRRIITPARFRAIQDWFGHYGRWVLFAARFMPGLRSAIFLTAGITRFVRYPVFILIDGIAATISVPLWIYLGHYGASNRDWLVRFISHSHIALLIAMAVFILLISLHTAFRYKVKKIEKEYRNGAVPGGGGGETEEAGSRR